MVQYLDMLVFIILYFLIFYIWYIVVIVSNNSTSNANKSINTGLMDKSNEDSVLRKKRENIQAASEKVDQKKIKNKLMKYPGDRIMKQQSGKLDAIFDKDANRLIKIEYYDTLLNAERKVDQFAKLFNKIRLRKIHKPFIILDMLKLMPKEETSVYVWSSLYNKLRRMKLRMGMNQIIHWVQYKKHLVDTLGRMGKEMLRRKRGELKKEIGRRLDKEVRWKRKNQILKRSLKYFGTMMNNIIRERKRNILGTIIIRLQNMDKRQGSNTELGIVENRGFVIQKTSKVRSNIERMNIQNMNRSRGNSRYENKDSGMRELSKEGVGMNDIMKDIKEEVQDLSPDKPKREENQENSQVAMSFGRNAGMNMLLKKGHSNNTSTENMRNTLSRGNSFTGNSNQNIVSKTNINPNESLPLKNVFSLRNTMDKKGDLLSQITREIMDINDQIVKDETNQNQELNLPQRIDLLNRLTTLMNLLRKYYEAERRRGGQEDFNQKKNFEQVLILVKRLMETLLKKMSTDLKSSQLKVSQKKIEGRGDGASDTRNVADDDHRSLARIDMMTRQLTRDLENLIPPTYEFETLGNTQNGSIYDPKDKEFQSISAINNLLQEVVQNLNNINENMDETNFGDGSNSQSFSGYKNSLPVSYSDRRTDASKYADYIEQSQNKGGLYGKGFLKRRNTSKLTNESDFKNSAMKNNYDPSFQMGFEDNKQISMQMLNFLGVLNFKIQKYNKKLIDQSFDQLIHKAVTEEFFHILRNMARELKKEKFFVSIAKLGVETNRRMHIRNHSLYKLNKALLIKKKWCLQVLKNGLNGDSVFDPNQVNMGDVNNYFGML